jgi:hypothetical protein
MGTLETDGVAAFHGMARRRNGKPFLPGEIRCCKSLEQAAMRQRHHLDAPEQSAAALTGPDEELE